MSTIFIFCLIALVYLNPFLLIWLWLRRLLKRSPVGRMWKAVMSWAALSLSTLAVGAFWIAASLARYPDPSPHKIVQIGFCSSLISAAGAIVAALLGEGKERTWVAISALIVPLNWLMWATWQ